MGPPPGTHGTLERCKMPACGRLPIKPFGEAAGCIACRQRFQQFTDFARERLRCPVGDQSARNGIGNDFGDSTDV